MLFNQPTDPNKPGTYIGGLGLKFLIDRAVERFNSPSHPNHTGIYAGFHQMAPARYTPLDSLPQPGYTEDQNQSLRENDNDHLYQ